MKVESNECNVLDVKDNGEKRLMDFVQPFVIKIHDALFAWIEILGSKN